MALWQYTFYVLPGKSLEIFSADFRFSNEENEFDDAPFWIEQKIDADFFNNINLILPKGKSWSKNIDLYGNQESNCFEVLFDKNMVISVSFRIYYTSYYKDILVGIIEFCILKGLVIVDENLCVAPLNFLTLKNIIDSCPQLHKYTLLSKSS
ncbi:MAG: hypothetical protein ABIN89_15140 [Chitinophagaceae bacterium]